MSTKDIHLKWLNQKFFKRQEENDFCYSDYQQFLNRYQEDDMEEAFFKFYPSTFHNSLFLTYMAWKKKLPAPTIALLNQWLHSLEYGLGVFYFLLKQKNIQEFLIHNCHISQEINNSIRQSPLQFSSNQHAWAFANKIAYDMKKNLSRTHCEIKGRWKHFRVQICTPPKFPSGVAISLRPISPPLRNLEQLFHNANQLAQTKLVYFLKKFKNIVICGETSSGKTSLLRWWLHTHIQNERVVIIDDSNELSSKTKSPHILNFVFSDEKDSLEIVKTALRFRPDKIIVGECRGHETISMLQSLRTGHWGSFSTLHASSLTDALTRLRQLTLNYAPHYSSAERDSLLSPISAFIVLRRTSTSRLIHSLHWKEGENWISHTLFY